MKRESLKKVIQKIRSDPFYFYEKILGDNLWEKQREIVQKIEDNKRVTIMSCNGAGKTYLIPRVALRFLVAYPNSMVINTAPTWRQIENQYWRHFRDAYNKARYHIGGQLLKTQFNFQENWFAMGIASDVKNVASFQGWHAKNVMVIFDEASGIPKPIWEAVEGLISGGVNVKFVVIGNPNDNLGDFIDTFQSNLYAKVYISAFDIPNVKEKRQVIPGLSTYEWVEEMREKYGEDSDVWRVRVLGQPPKQGSQSLISISLLESCFDADRELYKQDDEVLGVDVARYGTDKTALVLRKGNYAEVVEVIEKFSTMEVAGAVARYLRANKKTRAFIDITGGLGSGPFDRLREQSDIADRVYGVNVAGTAKDDKSYVNIRAESWDMVRQWLKDAVLKKHEGFYQLAHPRYKIASNGKIQLESKEDMKTRKVSSPDVGDALALTLSKATEGDDIGLVWI